MRSSRIAIALILCFCVALGGASAPARARAQQSAKPALVLEPNQAPCGDTVVAHGSGFPADALVEVTSTRPISPPPQESWPVLTATVGADGSFALDIVPCDPARPDADQEGLQYRVAAGTPTVELFADHEAYASAVYAVGAVGQRPLPTLTLTPGSGACNSPVVASGAYWFPGDQLSFAAFRVGGQQGQHFADAWVDADGTFSLPFEMQLATSCSGTKPPPVGAQYLIAIYQAQNWNYPRLDATNFIYTITKERLTERCFRETSLCVHGAFFERWSQQGLAGNGYPISPAYTRRLEDGRLYLVQYFERGRMEYHPENAPPHDILLGQFGRRILAGVPGAPTAPVGPLSGATYFAETGHNVDVRFMAYWSANGQLDQFGLPLTEAFEQRLEDGKVYRVQYFERARFEYHPENAGTPYEVLLGQFGRQILAGGGP
ncbi:MAG: hypothetical protein U0232_07430 [Thermomicrobiales bacterium]